MSYNGIKEEIKKYIHQDNFTKSVGWNKNSSKREIHSNSCLSQETKKNVSNKYPNLSPIGTRKRTKETQIQQKEGNKKIREEINK